MTLFGFRVTLLAGRVTLAVTPDVSCCRAGGRGEGRCDGGV